MSSDDVVGRWAAALGSPIVVPPALPRDAAAGEAGAGTGDAARPEPADPESGPGPVDPERAEPDLTALGPAERAAVDRVRRLLAHPATWAIPPDLAMPLPPPAAATTVTLTAPVVPAARAVPVVPVIPAAPVVPDSPGDLPPHISGDLSPLPEGPEGLSPPADPPADGRAHPVSAARPRGRRTRRPGWALGVVTALAAAAILLLWFVPGWFAQPESDILRMELAGTGTASAASAAVVATEHEAGWKITLDITELPPAPEGTYYEGWLAGPELVVPLGTFHLDEPGEVGLWSGVPLRGFDSVVVTVQQIGGTLEPGEAVLTGEIPAR